MKGAAPVLYGRAQPAALVREAVSKSPSPTNTTSAENRPLRSSRKMFIRFIVFLLENWPRCRAASCLGCATSHGTRSAAMRRRSRKSQIFIIRQVITADEFSSDPATTMARDLLLGLYSGPTNPGCSAMHVPGSNPKGYRFGVFEVDLLAREVRRNGRRINLQDQPFRVLALLLSR